MATSIVYMPIAEDQVALWRGWYGRALRRPRSYIPLLILTGAGTAWTSWQEWHVAGEVTGIYSLRLLAVMAAGVGIVVALQALLMPVYLRRLFRQQKSIGSETTFAWHEGGIDVVSSNSTNRLRWAELHDWWETRDLVAFALHDQLYLYAPKRALSGAQLTDLRMTAREGFEAGIAGRSGRP